MKNRSRYDVEPITRGDLDRAIAKLSSAIQMGIITPKRSGGGGPDGKALVAMLNTYLGSTAWQSGSAAEIVAALSGLDPEVGTLTLSDAAPGTNAEAVAVIGQKDSSVASKATLDIETEEAVAVVGTFTASHKIAVWINGTEYNIQLDAV